MVNWKSSESTDRLIASLIAAHPSLKVSSTVPFQEYNSPYTKTNTKDEQLQYDAMAAFFGQDATHDSIEARFRRYRRMAEELRHEAKGKGVEIPRGGGRNAAIGSRSGPSTPRTPRTAGSRNWASSTKHSAISTKTGVQQDVAATPTKSSKYAKAGSSVLDAICIDDDGDTTIKLEDEEGEQRGGNLNTPSSLRIKRERGDDHAMDNDLFVKQENERVDSRTNGYVESPNTARRVAMDIAPTRTGDIFAVNVDSVFDTNAMSTTGYPRFEDGGHNLDFA